MASNFRPRITHEEFDIIKDYRESKKEFSLHCKQQGIDEKTVPMYWDKSKRFSIKVHPNQNTINQEEQIERLISKISNHAPNYEPFKRKFNKVDNLLVIDIADAHFGKLASAYETGKAYDIQEAKKRCIEGVEGIISKCEKFSFKKVLMIAGNDVLHYDNPRQTTTSGTLQNSDVMFFDMFNVALETYVQIIESLLIDYDVDIVFNPSNHDYQSGWMFARTLSAWFKNCKNVTIDDSIAHRKYYKFGNNMIGSNHGDGAKLDVLPLLMAQENPKMWAETKYRYVYLHHIHHKQVYKFLSGKDFIGVTVEYLRSPSEADSWHSRNGYCGNKKAIEGFIHNYDEGQIGRITHYF